MRSIWIIAASCALLTASCVHSGNETPSYRPPPPAPQSHYERIDGQPAPVRQFEADRAICSGEMGRVMAAAAPGDGLAILGAVNVAKGCMAQRGYIEVQGPAR